MRPDKLMPFTLGHLGDLRRAQKRALGLGAERGSFPSRLQVAMRGCVSPGARPVLRVEAVALEEELHQEGNTISVIAGKGLEDQTGFLSVGRARF